MPSMQVILAVAGYFVFAAAVGAMAAPTDAQKTRFYGWLYRFLQRLAANADRMAEARFGNLIPPGDGDESVAVATRERESVAVLTSSSGTTK
jgi:hypothetical protein